MSTPAWDNACQRFIAANRKDCPMSSPLPYVTHGRKEGNGLFNDALNTFYLRSYGVGHMVNDHSDSERGKLATTTWATLSY